MLWPRKIGHKVLVFISKTSNLMIELRPIDDGRDQSLSIDLVKGEHRGLNLGVKAN